MKVTAPARACSVLCLAAVIATASCRGTDDDAVTADGSTGTADAADAGPCTPLLKNLMPCAESQIGLTCESAGYCPTHYFFLTCGYYESKPSWLETSDDNSWCPRMDASPPEVGTDGCPATPDIGGRPCTEKGKECRFRHLCPTTLVIYRCEVGLSGGLIWNGRDGSC